MRLLLICAAVVLLLPGKAQDTVYARQILKFLTSKKCFGRGYVKNGLDVAAKEAARGRID